MTELQRTGRWNWAVAATLVLGAIGLASREYVLVLAGTIPLWYLVSTAITGMSIPRLDIERSIDGDATAPGEYVPVELTVRNVGEAPVTDLRIIDGVPDELSVPEGDPRACRTLQPGESTTLSYLVSARRGEFPFQLPRVRVRNLTGTVGADLSPHPVEDDLATDGGVAAEQTAVGPTAATVEDDQEAAAGSPTASSDSDPQAVSPDADRPVLFRGDRTIECELPVEDVPLSDQTLDRTGRVDADEGGTGIQFHSVRDYQRGDPKRAINWRRYAKTGELTTVEYNEERAATVVIVVDARDETFVSADRSDPAAVTLSTFAAERTFDALSSRGHEVGLTALGVGQHPLIGPGTGSDIEQRVHEELDTIRAKQPRWMSLNARDQDMIAERAVRRLGNKLPGEAQVLFFTPALDEFSELVCRGVIAHGHGMTVVSPDVTTAEEPGQYVMSAERQARLTRIRATGGHVVDWGQDRPLQLVLEDALSWGETR